MELAPGLQKDAEARQLEERSASWHGVPGGLQVEDNDELELYWRPVKIADARNGSSPKESYKYQVEATQERGHKLQDSELDMWDSKSVVAPMMPL